ncbi:MAG TPA: hypothetical protein VFA10_10945 [Ktedonobacteraceae bacterium]|nr:hypothetical protein [Ktedonobacteraceae bacterium]
MATRKNAEERTTVAQYASPITEAEHQTLLEKIAYIPENIDAGTSQLTTLSYQVDHAIREACLAAPGQWREESGTLVFTSSNGLKVYLGKPSAPLPIEEAQARIRELGISTVITARIVLGLWNARKSNRLLQTTDGSAVMRLGEIFEWRGIKKHIQTTSPGSEKRYTGGYSTELKSQVLKDLDLLASCCIKGPITCVSDSRRIQESINDSYLQYGIIVRDAYRPEGITVGICVRPGNWLQTYINYGNYFITKTDRKVFQFHPSDQQHELKLTLFLTERWRQQRYNSEEPITMAHLLALSMIRVDKKHLTGRFSSRIQEALEALQKQGIIGQLLCIAPVDTSQPRWGNTWLASRWVITPPKDRMARVANDGANRTRASGELSTGVRAIETVYAGYRFRSRNEARWCVFFDALGIEYRYELEGFDFDGIRYLPDFWLPGYNCWVEIKGEAPTEDELRKAHLLALYTEKPIYLFFGDIWPLSQEKYGGAYRFSGPDRTQGHYWYECVNCHMVGLASAQENGNFLCQCATMPLTQSTFDSKSARLLEAYRKARQARFEYGEQGTGRRQQL